MARETLVDDHGTGRSSGLARVTRVQGAACQKLQTENVDKTGAADTPDGHRCGISNSCVKVRRRPAPFIANQ